VAATQLFCCASSITALTGTTKTQQRGNLSLASFEVRVIWWPYNNVEIAAVNQYSIFWLTVLFDKKVVVKGQFIVSQNSDPAAAADRLTPTSRL
jgi:hypothetical protein